MLIVSCKSQGRITCWEFTDWEPNFTMQNHEYFYPEKFAFPVAPKAADTYLHGLLVSALDAVLPSGARPKTPFERVELQPSEVCPKNFVIFDQTDNQSRITFHPAMANKFSGPGLNFHATYNRDSEKNKANPVEGELSYSFEEDSKDMDALLSLEVEELEDHDEEELSTARTNENYESICLVDINRVGARVRKILWC